jgi:hypothetical protein
MDREGDVWRETGRGVGRDAVLVCDEPADPSDQGEGETDWPWTVETVEAWCGPLTPLADVRSIRDEVEAEDGYLDWRRSA